MIKTKKEESDLKNTGKEIRAVWRNFSTLHRRNKLKLNKRRTILHQTRYIIIFDFFYADHSILKPSFATHHNILNLVLVAIQQAPKSLVGCGNRTQYWLMVICDAPKIACFTSVCGDETTLIALMNSHMLFNGTALDFHY